MICSWRGGEEQGRRFQDWRGSLISWWCQHLQVVWTPGDISEYNMRQNHEKLSATESRLVHQCICNSMTLFRVTYLKQCVCRNIGSMLINRRPHQRRPRAFSIANSIIGISIADCLNRDRELSKVKNVVRVAVLSGAHFYYPSATRAENDGYVLTKQISPIHSPGNNRAAW